MNILQRRDLVYEISTCILKTRQSLIKVTVSMLERLVERNALYTDNTASSKHNLTSLRYNWLNISPLLEWQSSGRYLQPTPATTRVYHMTQQPGITLLSAPARLHMCV